MVNLEKPKEPVIMLIDWIDSCGSTAGWQHNDECKAHVLTCQTIGFLVDETEDAICLALNRTTMEGYRPYGDLISIPKITIKRTKKFKTAEFDNQKSQKCRKRRGYISKSEGQK